MGKLFQTFVMVP